MDKNRFIQWPEFVVGVLFALLGILSFVFPDFALPMITILYGLVALLSGISNFINWFTVERRRAIDLVCRL